MAVVVQIQDHQRAVQLVELLDDAMERRDFWIGLLGLERGFDDDLFQRRDPLAPLLFPPVGRDRHVERDAIDPGR